MYNRIFEQISVGLVTTFFSGICVLLIANYSDVSVYGQFLSELAIQYILVRILLSGAVVELQLQLSACINKNSCVSYSLFQYSIVAFILACFLLVIFNTISIIDFPWLGMIFGLSFISSITLISVRAWFWSRLSSISSEILLLLLLLISRNSLNLERFFYIYLFYYLWQLLVALVSLVILSFQNTIRFSNINSIHVLTFKQYCVAGLASISTMAKDKLVVAVSGILFPPSMVAGLTYLLTVPKIVNSFGAKINLVKILTFSGTSRRYNFRNHYFFLEILSLCLISLLAFAPLFLYTKFLGNFEYLSFFRMQDIFALSVSVGLIYVQSSWYSSLALGRSLHVYSMATLVFCVFFLLVGLFIKLFPANIDSITFYAITQALLCSSCLLVKRLYAN